MTLPSLCPIKSRPIRPEKKVATPEGKCCICGVVGKLSFEHVPPEKAFNDHGVFEADIMKMLGGAWVPGEKPKDGRISQRGAGRYTLCGKCNSDTGSWYGGTYVDVTKQAMYLLWRSRGEMSLAYPYRMYPLRFLKQVVTMFLSACGPGLQEHNPDLVRFVLNREARALPPKFQFYAYLHHPESSAMRQSGLTGVIRGTGNVHVFSEIAFPPFGLIMNVDGDQPIDRRLCNITHLREYSYRAWDIVYLQMPVLHVTSVLPGDFRTVDEVKRDVAANEKAGAMLLEGHRDGPVLSKWPGSPY
jgi:hypothetical protein